MVTQLHTIKKSTRTYLMNIKSNFSKLNINYISLAISIFAFYITTFGDSLAFEPAGEYWNNALYYVVKMVVLALFIFISQLIPYLFIRYKSGGYQTRKMVNYFFTYVAIMIIFLLLVYPGNMSGFNPQGMDESFILNGARTLDIFDSWQHVLMVIWYAVCLSIFPSVGTIVFMQILLISSIVAYVMKSSLKICNAKYVNVFFLIFLLPSVIFYNLDPLRLTLYSYLELLIFFIIAIKYLKNEKFTASTIIALALLISVVSSLRTESLIYVLLIPLILFILFVKRGNITWIQIVLLSSSIILLVLGINYIQNLNKTDSLKYQVTALIMPLGSVLSGGDYKAEDKTYVKSVVDKAIDYDRLVTGESPDVVYWSRAERSISDEDLFNLKAVTVKLVADNPWRYSKGVVKGFIASNTMQPNLSTGEGKIRTDFTHADGLLYSKPISEDIRSGTVAMLGSKSYDYEHYTPSSRIFRNALVVGIIMMVAMAYMLAKKDLFVIIMIPIIARNIIVALTAPLTSFYYYFPFQLTVLVLIAVYVLSNLSYKKLNRSDPQKRTA